MNTINDNFELQYIPARICDDKELTIKYYAWHPTEHKLKRVVMRFNHLKTKMNKTDLNRHVRKIANDINVQLANGKNPFVDAETPKSYHKLSDALEMFLKIKGREMRPDGMRSYNSFCKKMNAWITSKKMKDCFVISFNKELALEMMNDLALDEKISNRTWNNHFNFYRSLWNWFINNYYCKNNVFSNFEKKREAEKFRIIIPPAIHSRVATYCKEKMPNMEIVIDLVRASFIRPKEISLIQIKDIDLFNHVITIPADKSKTHNKRFAYLPEWLCTKIIDNFELDSFPMDFYLFVSDGDVPNTLTRSL